MLSDGQWPRRVTGKVEIGKGQQVTGSWQWWPRERAFRSSHKYLTSTSPLPSTVPAAGNRGRKKVKHTPCFCRAYVLGAKKNMFKVYDQFRWWGFKEEAIFAEWGTWRGWPGNSSLRWWLWCRGLNEDLREKHSRQGIVLEATTNLVFLKTRKAAMWLEHREGGRDEMGWLLQQLHFIKPTN